MDEAVMDEVEVIEPIEGEDTGEVEVVEPVEGKEDDPYSSKSSREYSQWLKGLKESNPENGKFARLSKDNHARMYQLQQMEPRGVDGIRETYALLDSVMHGELKGRDALGAIQDELRSVAETDALLASGDPKALDVLGEQFNDGLAKLTPTILDRVREVNPEAYKAAVLPHFVDALASSPLIQSFHGLIDKLNEKPPSYLNDDQKAAWAADNRQGIVNDAKAMNSWLAAQERAVGDRKLNPAGPGKPTGTPENAELETLRKEQQTQHWNSNITPKLDEHANKRFDEEFRAYDKRLRLDPTTKAALRQEWSSRISKTAMKPGQDGKLGAYAQQIGRYRAQAKPDPATVLNFAKVEFDKHAKTVLESLVNERYKSFLKGKPAIPTPTNGNAPPPKVGVSVVTVRPADGTYDPKARTPAMIHDKIFPLKNGKVVQLQR